jgi:hypothetical protein
MKSLSCATVLRDLTAFHDRELPVERLIAVEAHLAGCSACAREAAALRTIGDALRAGAAALQRPPAELAGLRDDVLSRLRGEYETSWRGRLAHAFEDLHLVWIGLSSAAATVLCVALALACLEFASPEREDSLAGIIAAIQAAKTNLVRQADDPATDRIQWAVEQSMSEGEAVLALMTVVTRDGRLVDLRLVDDSRDRQAIEHLLNAIAAARFEPARYPGSPMPTNVSVLWYLTRTTVRGKIIS